MNGRFAPVAIALLLVGGCAGSPSTPSYFQSGSAMPVPLDASVLILPSDIEVSVVGVGGDAEPRADWSQAAAEGLNDALDEFFFNRGVMPVRYDHDAIADEDLDIIRQANVNLDAIQLAQQGGAMAGIREYALAPELTRNLEEYDADYAVFVMLRARQASAGRTATRVIGGLMGGQVTVGGNAIPDAYRVALIDLRDGQFVWANIDPRQELGNPGEADIERWLGSFEMLFRGFPL